MTTIAKAGTKTRKKPWMFEIRCPYCKVRTVQIVDHSKLYGYYSEQKCEQVIDEECIEDHVECDHLAFWSDWAYSGTEIKKAWAGEVKQISQAILAEEQDKEADGEGYGREEDDENTDDESDGHDLANYLWHAFHEVGEINKKHLEQKMRKSLKGHDVKFEGGYVERNDGVSGGGPTYMLIYLRKKTHSSI